MITTTTAAQLPDLCADPTMRCVSLLSATGNLAQITGSVETSSVMPGAMAVETEHGTIYLDTEEELRVQVDSELDRRSARWMQTYSGRQFFPLDPRAEDVDITDIAHALGHLCRYNGHVKRFYSVAQHCVLVSENVDPEHALWGLLHDAAEAYVGDMISPLKVDMPQFRRAEDRIIQAIAERFSMTGSIPEQVHEVDRRLRVDEARDLLGEPPAPWVDHGAALGVSIEPWSPELAAKRYIERFMQLTREVRRVG